MGSYVWVDKSTSIHAEDLKHTFNAPEGWNWGEGSLSYKPIKQETFIRLSAFIMHTRAKTQRSDKSVSGCPRWTPTRPIFLQASWPSGHDYRSEGDARCLPGSGSFHNSLEPMPPRLGLFTSLHLQMQNILALATLPKFLRGSISCLYSYPHPTPVHSLN